MSGSSAAAPGHGFKHGPALAEYVEKLLDGAEEPDPMFGLGSAVTRGRFARPLDRALTR